MLPQGVPMNAQGQRVWRIFGCIRRSSPFLLGLGLTRWGVPALEKAEHIAPMGRWWQCRRPSGAGPNRDLHWPWNVGVSGLSGKCKRGSVHSATAAAHTPVWPVQSTTPGGRPGGDAYCQPGGHTHPSCAAQSTAKPP